MNMSPDLIYKMTKRHNSCKLLCPQCSYHLGMNSQVWTVVIVHKVDKEELVIINEGTGLILLTVHMVEFPSLFM